MNRAMLAVGVAGVLAYCMPVTAASALSVPNPTTYTDEAQARATGLIIQYSLGITAGNDAVILSGSTISNDTMKSIGLTDIVVEYSSDCEDWDVERTATDILKSNAMNYRFSGHSISVNGGYYYRISCNHYAKKSLFGSSQSVSNTSNSVWVT